MRFYNHKSSVIFDIYLKLYDSELSFEKKKLIFKSLLAMNHGHGKLLVFQNYVLIFQKINLKNLEN